MSIRIKRKRGLKSVAIAFGALLLLVAVLALSPVGRFGYRWLTNPSYRLLIGGASTSSDVLLRNLDSADRDIVLDSLHFLAQRRDPLAREKALLLLKSRDEYVWLNAALYLAAIGDAASIPYLIRGLRHPAYDARDDVVSYLKILTGQSFGPDQDQWLRWWNATHQQSGL